MYAFLARLANSSLEAPLWLAVLIILIAYCSSLDPSENGIPSGILSAISDPATAPPIPARPPLVVFPPKYLSQEVNPLPDLPLDNTNAANAAAPPPRVSAVVWKPVVSSDPL